MTRVLKYLAMSGFTALVTIAVTPAAQAQQIDLNGDLCAQAPHIDLNDVIARGDFADVIRNGPVSNLPPPSNPTPSQQAMETVVVDGVIMELPQWVIEGQIRAGAFIPVYPGTRYPIAREDWWHELPCWANPDCPIHPVP